MRGNGVHAAHGSDSGDDTRTLLSSVARVVLSGQRGSLADQLDRLRRARCGAAYAQLPRASALADSAPAGPVPRASSSSSTAWAASRADGREYVTAARAGPDDAGAVDQRDRQSALRIPGRGRGRRLHLGAATAARTSSRPWSNDPVTDRPGEAIYLRDEETGELWSPTAAPIRDERAQLLRSRTARATAASSTSRTASRSTC